MDLQLAYREFMELSKANPVISWITAFLAALVLTFLVKAIFNLVCSRVSRLAGKTVNGWDDLLVDELRKVRGWAIFVWIAYPLLRTLHPNETILQFARAVVILVTLVQVWMLGSVGMRFWKSKYLDRRVQQDASSAAVLGLLYLGIQAAFFCILILFGLSNLGVDIAALLAGLGVGGIAVALAAQNILGDLLASLSIVLDKPFVVGDFVVVGTEAGTVEQIGIKTTRLRSLSGEQVVLSNRDMLESRVRNYKRMWERRVVQTIRVSYDTPLEKLQAIPQMIKAIFEDYSQLRLDRCHFYLFGNSSLDFEIVFFVKSPDYNLYMDWQQGVLFSIVRKFREERIAFALPTQTLYMRDLASPDREQVRKEPPGADLHPH